MAITNFSHGGRGLVAVTDQPTDWQTLPAAAALGAGHAIEAFIEGLPLPVAGKDELTVFNGTTLMSPSLKVTEELEGTINAPCPFYMQNTALVAKWWGGEATAQQGGTAAYLHTFTFDEDIEGEILSFGATDRIRLREVPSVKVEKKKYIFERGRVGRVEYGVVCDRMIVDDSGTNTLAGFNAAVTYLAQPTTRYLHIGSTQFVVRVNAFSGGALGAGDIRYPERIELNFERNWKRFSRTDTGLYLSEPVGGDWRLIGGRLDFPVDTATGDWSWLLNNTGLKMDIAATGDLIAGAFSYAWTWLYPYIELDSEGLPQLDTADVLVTSFPFVARRARSVPAGFSLQVPSMTVQDIRTSNWLTA